MLNVLQPGQDSMNYDRKIIIITTWLVVNEPIHSKGTQTGSVEAMAWSGKVKRRDGLFLLHGNVISTISKLR